jgi:ribonuclease D
MSNNKPKTFQGGKRGNAKITDKTVVFVQTNQALLQAVKDIQQYSIIGVDLEADSFYRYYEKICLVQIATPKNIYLIDTLANVDHSLLKSIFENPAIEKIFHDPVSYDIGILKRKLGIHPVNIFDTQLAAQLLGVKHLGLDALLKRYFGIKITKKFKRADWGRRPLPKEWLTYAANDVRYLLELRALLTKELGVNAVFRDKCKQMENIERIPKEFDPMGYTKLRGAKQLSDQKRKVLKNLYLWREKEARRVDRSPFMILQPSMLVPLARKEITDVEGVKSFLGKKRRKNQKLCQAIFEAIQLGIADTEIEL